MCVRVGVGSEFVCGLNQYASSQKKTLNHFIKIRFRSPSSFIFIQVRPPNGADCGACVTYDKVLRASGERVAAMEIEANLFDVVTPKQMRIKKLENMQDKEGHLLVYRRGQFAMKYRGEDDMDKVQEFVMKSSAKHSTQKRRRRELGNDMGELKTVHGGPSWLSSHGKVRYQLDEIQRMKNPKHLAKAYDKLLRTVEKVFEIEGKEGHLAAFSELIEGLFPVETLRLQSIMLQGKEKTPEYDVVMRHLRAAQKNRGKETVPLISAELKMIEKLEAKLENAAGPQEVKKISEQLKKIRKVMHDKATRLDRPAF